MSREEYLSAENAMKILFVSIIFATWGNLYSSGGLLQAEKENTMLIATTSGAIFNMALNYILIPIWGCTAAAAATLITEICIFSCLLYFFRKNVGTKVGDRHVLKCLLATVPFAFVRGVSEMVGLTGMLFHLFEIVICMVLYFVGLIILKDELVKNLNWRTLDEERNKA